LIKTTTNSNRFEISAKIKMEGLCDMFAEENHDDQSKGFVEENEYKFV